MTGAQDAGGLTGKGFSSGSLWFGLVFQLQSPTGLEGLSQCKFFISPISCGSGSCNVHGVRAETAVLMVVLMPSTYLRASRCQIMTFLLPGPLIPSPGKI